MLDSNRLITWWLKDYTPELAQHVNMSNETFKVHCKKLFLDFNSLLPVV